MAPRRTRRDRAVRLVQLTNGNRSPELRALLVHEPLAGDELVWIGRIGGAPGHKARRRQPGARQCDGPFLRPADGACHVGEDEGDGLDRLDAGQGQDLGGPWRPGVLLDGRVELAADCVREGIGGLGGAAGARSQRHDCPRHDRDDPGHDEHRQPSPAQRGANPEDHSPHASMKRPFGGAVHRTGRPAARVPAPSRGCVAP